MRRSLTILLILFAAAAYTPLRAQSLDAFKERLAAPVASDAHSARQRSPSRSAGMRRGP